MCWKYCDTDKKEKNLIYQEIQKGEVEKSYVTSGHLTYD